MFATCIYLVCIYPPLFYAIFYAMVLAPYHPMASFFNAVSLQEVLIHQNVFLETFLWSLGICMPAWRGYGVVIIVVYFMVCVCVCLKLIWMGLGALLGLKFCFFELDYRSMGIG